MSKKLFQGREKFKCPLSSDCIVVDSHDKPLVLSKEEQTQMIESNNLTPIYQPIYHNDGRIELQIIQYVFYTEEEKEQDREMGGACTPL
jgi:hypothetical protein